MENNKVFILDQTTIKKLLTIYKLVIPDFQRNFVWKKGKKEQLLDSLFRGFPIGAITLYDDENAYYIIDGLQRINTLTQYLSRPGAIIPFGKYYEKVEPKIREFLEKKQAVDLLVSLKKCIKIWYEGLDSLYEFEKMSVLYGVLKNGSEKIANAFESLEMVEELLELLKAKIEIVHDDIALIIYNGNKNDLPDLFKNINTGSVALSQYEILQSVWNGYTVERELVADAGEAFDRELELIRNDYEISAVKEAGTFDIFKNIIGINHMICCMEDSNVIFRFASFKKLPKENVKDFGNGIVKYYENDSIAFELYSTILCNAPNQIVKAIDTVYKGKDEKKISWFIRRVNHIMIDAVALAIVELKKRNDVILESKYHSLYILAGLIFSKYDIDLDTLTVEETSVDRRIYAACLDIEKHKKEKWFIDENRQVSFFNIKVEELAGMKKESQDRNQEDRRPGILEIQVGDEVIRAGTVKAFYRKIFQLLCDRQIDFSDKLPYATGTKRYLVSRTKYHINGNPFVSPIQVEDYYIETHKSKSGALNDIYNFLKNIGVPVSYEVSQ